jgi:hypothetical protein
LRTISCSLGGYGRLVTAAITMNRDPQEGEMEVDVNGVAQVIAVVLGGASVLLRALAVFLPVWREKPPKPPAE